jgi:hypothetical protein
VRGALLLVVTLAAGCASAGSKDPAYGRPDAGSAASAEATAPRKDPAYDFVLAASYVAPAPAADAKGPQFSGISGLAPLRDGREMLAVADDRDDSRVYRITVDWGDGRLQVSPTGVIPLQRGGGAPNALDPEGIAITRDGHFIVSSEGIGNQEPRLPPALVEYGIDGRFIRQLPVHPRYAPAPRGPLVSGVRDNAGFESLTISPDFSRLFTATELPLAQDGEVDPFTASVRSRILEYVAEGDSYRPAREFVYELAPLEPVRYQPRFAINGVVELLALSDGALLVLERGFVESVDRTQAVNRIRLFRAVLDGATDVSRFDSLREAGPVTPVRKTLLLDVNRVGGLEPRLAALDNFEGMAWGPALTPRGPRSLVIVSDDNESARQVTAFLLFKR